MEILFIDTGFQDRNSDLQDSKSNWTSLFRIVPASDASSPTPRFSMTTSRIGTRAHREQAVTTAGQGGYNASVHNVYGYNATVNNVYGNAEDDAVRALQQAATDSLSTIAGGLADNQTGLAELAQANAVLTATNTTMAAQMAQLMSGMQLLQTQMAAGPAIV
eukprot:scaffold126324_cov59-Attheya_sp.AAC.1